MLAVHQTVYFPVALTVKLRDQNVTCELIAVIKAAPQIKYNYKGRGMNLFLLSA